MVEEGQTSSMSLIENEGPTSPSVLSEPRKPSAIDEQSLMVAELAEASQEEEELRRRNQELEQEDKELRQRLQELENVQNRAVTGTVIVENDDDDDEDSSICGLSRNCFFLVVAVLLLIIVGVILGVFLGLSTPTKAPTPTVTPTQSPTAVPCTSLECLRLAEILLQNEVSDAEALQDDSSPQFLALRWLANNDTTVLDLDNTPTVNLVERYVLAVLYFATSTEGGLNALKSVCAWTDVSCNGDDLVIALNLSKSKHEEVIVLISKFRIDSPVYLPFYLNRF
jgi:hypothetical protein